MDQHSLERHVEEENSTKTKVHDFQLFFDYEHFVRYRVRVDNLDLYILDASVECQMDKDEEMDTMHFYIYNHNVCNRKAKEKTFQ